MNIADAEVIRTGDDFWDDNAPDVHYYVTKESGKVLLVIQTESEALSASWLALDYDKIQLRYVYDNDRLEEGLVPKWLIVFVGDDMTHPILRAAPSQHFMPLRKAITKGRRWAFAIQVMVQGEKHVRVWEVESEPVWTATSAVGQDGVTMWPGWPFKVR